MKYTSNSPEQTKEIASNMIHSTKSKTFALFGDLGSGKTTFAQGFGEALGIKRMVSPTYILLRNYKITNQHYPLVSNLYHADLYRLSSPQEVIDIGLSEIWSDPNNLVLIEWPEKILNLLPKNTTKISF